MTFLCVKPTNTINTNTKNTNKNIQDLTDLTVSQRFISSITMSCQYVSLQSAHLSAGEEGGGLAEFFWTYSRVFQSLILLKRRKYFTYQLYWATYFWKTKNIKFLDISYSMWIYWHLTQREKPITNLKIDQSCP